MTPTTAGLPAYLFLPVLSAGLVLLDDAVELLHLLVDLDLGGLDLVLVGGHRVALLLQGRQPLVQLLPLVLRRDGSGEGVSPARRGETW